MSTAGYERKGVRETAGEPPALAEGDAAFVPAGAEHRLTGYEGLAVLVVFTRSR